MFPVAVGSPTWYGAAVTLWMLCHLGLWASNEELCTASSNRLLYTLDYTTLLPGWGSSCTKCRDRARYVHLQHRVTYFVRLSASTALQLQASDSINEVCDRRLALRDTNT